MAKLESSEARNNAALAISSGSPTRPIGMVDTILAKQMQKKIDSIPAAVMKALKTWEWPGNIRELENLVERAVILTRGRSLEAPLSELSKVKVDDGERTPADPDNIARIVK